MEFQISNSGNAPFAMVGTSRCGVRTARRAVPTLKEASASPFTLRAAFTLIELLVAMALMSLIVLALMTVFNSTQTAFRAGLTQTDVLESGRATMDLIKSDLQGMTPSFGTNNGPVNFYAGVNSGYVPLIQPLVASGNQRTNVLESFFILSRNNVNGSPSWIGTGYVVDTNSPDGGLYPLYRFYETTNIITGNPASLYNDFSSTSLTNSPPWSHLMDGVVHLIVRAYDANGVWMNWQNWQNGFVTSNNIAYQPIQFGEGGFYMFSNMVPASVEIEMGVLEDHTLQHAEGLIPSGTNAVTSYLAQHVGQVHLFRQRVPIRNVDPSAYQ
jgi:prepilin-type N-terminal cleavage/methylation domain-containing protein